MQLHTLQNSSNFILIEKNLLYREYYIFIYFLNINIIENCFENNLQNNIFRKYAKTNNMNQEQ